MRWRMFEVLQAGRPRMRWRMFDMLQAGRPSMRWRMPQHAPEPAFPLRLPLITI